MTADRRSGAGSWARRAQGGLVGLALAAVAGGVLSRVGPVPPSPTGDRAATAEAPARAAPVLAGRGREGVESRGLPRSAPVPHVATLGASAPEAAWAAAATALPRLAEAERDALRAAVAQALVAALHPTAEYRGGTAAPRLAAAVADEATRDLLLELLRSRERVAAKLPLTDTRDDLVLIDVVAGAVLGQGTDRQRARLRALLQDQGSRETDPAARARIEAWGRGGAR